MWNNKTFRAQRKLPNCGTGTLMARCDMRPDGADSRDVPQQEAVAMEKARSFKAARLLM